MTDPIDIPYARPVQAIVTRVPPDPPPVPTAQAVVSPPNQPTQVATPRQRPDGFAVASAVCGFSAIIPIVAQVIGLVLGAVGLARIRRARRRGAGVGGVKWAVAGILSSGFVLLGWVGLFVAMNLLSASLTQSAGSLHNLLQAAPAGS